MCLLILLLLGLWLVECSSRFCWGNVVRYFGVVKVLSRVMVVLWYWSWLLVVFINWESFSSVEVVIVVVEVFFGLLGILGVLKFQQGILFFGSFFRKIFVVFCVCFRKFVCLVFWAVRVNLQMAQVCFFVYMELLVYF